MDRFRLFRLSGLALILVGGLAMADPSPELDAEGPLTEQEVEEAAQLIRKAHDEARKAVEALPQDRFEMGVLLEEAEFDPETIAQWVADEIDWIPYEGVLRGANGVLLDRQGNSLDRSLLLSELLETAGYDTRLVQGQRSEEAIEQLAGLEFNVRPATYAQDDFFPAEVVAAARRVPAEAAALLSLAGDSINQGSSDQRIPVQHWWVEANIGGDWKTFDSIFSGNLEAVRPVPENYLSADSIPEAQYHSITVRVVIERWDQGELYEEVPLEHSLIAADAAFHDLEISFAPFHFEPASAEATAVDEALVLADTSQEWQPVLRFGDTVVRNQGFNRQGELVRHPGRQAIIRKMESSTEALQMLGGDEQKESSQLTASWIEYAVNSPGQPVQVVRREVFDLIGPAMRADGNVEEFSGSEQWARKQGTALLGAHRVLVTSAEIPPVALQKAALQLWTVHGPQLAALVRLARDPDASEPLQRFYREPLVSLDLLALASARHNLTDIPAHTFLASPNILSTHFTVDIGHELQINRGYDIVFNRVGAVPSGNRSPSVLRLQQGVLDTTLEAALSDTSERSGNAAELFAQRGSGMQTWLKVTQAAEVAGLPSPAQGRISDAMDKGRLVVAPSKLDETTEPGWWEIDPQSGSTLGIGARGWGQAVEDATTRTIVGGATAHGGRQYGIRVSCAVVLAYLKKTGWVFQNISGGWTYLPYAVDFLLRRGCSIVV